MIDFLETILNLIAPIFWILVILVLAIGAFTLIFKLINMLRFEVSDLIHRTRRPRR